MGSERQREKERERESASVCVCAAGGVVEIIVQCFMLDLKIFQFVT